MTETITPRLGSQSPSVVPSKRTLEEDVPLAPSPLNPETASATLAKAAKDKEAMQREKREKKETLKKREAKSNATSTTGKVAPNTAGKDSAKSGKGSGATTDAITPVRYKLAAPGPADFRPPSTPMFQFHHTKPRLGAGLDETDFHEPSDVVVNRKGFRYTPCFADAKFPSIMYRQAEAPPYKPRISFEDCSSHILYNQGATQITTDKGFRMARANVGAREGRWFWECKIRSGIAGNARRSSVTTSIESMNKSGKQALQSNGHVRIGWARREACLDAPVGYDAYSYGLRDVDGQKVHMSRPVDFFPPNTSILEGDVIGLELELPSLSLHQKVVEGDYNPAVDFEDTVAERQAAKPIIRDRIPIHYKSNMYFEQFEYASTKEVEDLCHPTSGTTITSTPSSTHPSPSLRTLPHSAIRVYRNGELMGEPFTDLLAFLPPASKPPTQLGAREGLDDGNLGYFPAISVFRGGAAEINLGPDFWFPINKDVGASEESARAVTTIPENPAEMTRKPARPMAERYAESVAESTVYDIIDEVELWLENGGRPTTANEQSIAKHEDTEPKKPQDGRLDANGSEQAETTMPSAP